MSRRLGIAALLLTVVLFPARTAWADAGVTLVVNPNVGTAAGSTLDLLGSYTILGPDTITDFHLRIDLPAHTALKDIPYAPPGLTCSQPSASVVDCSAPSSAGLASYAYFDFLFSVDANTVPDTPLPFTFTILGNGITTPLPDRTKTLTAYVIGPNDPATTLSAPRSIAPGSTLTATATMTNNGPYDAHRPEVFLTMWNGLTPLDITSFTAPEGWRCNGGSNGTPVGCTTDIMTPGNVAVITFSAVLPQSATGSVTSQASTSSWFDASNLNNTPVATTFIGTPPPSADLSVTISASPSQVKPGDTVTYTVSLQNSSAVNASGVALSFAMSPALTVVSNTMPCSAGPCDMGTIVTGETRTFTITALANQAPGTIVTATAVTSATNDDTPANNQATAVFAILDTDANVDLSLAMTAAPPEVHPGDLITLTYVVTNHGSAGATGVSVLTDLPPNLGFVAGSGIVGTLAAGESKTVTVTAAANGLGSDTVAANVTSAEADRNAADNSASQSIAVTPVPSTRRRSAHH